MSGEMGAGNMRTVHVRNGQFVIHAGGVTWTPATVTKFQIGDKVVCLYSGDRLMVGAVDGLGMPIGDREVWQEC